MSTDLQRVIDALASPIRREILWWIRDAESSAGEIAGRFEVTAPTISEHLAVLRRAGLVAMRVDGTFRRYRTNLDALRGLEPLLGTAARWTPTGREADASHAVVEQGIAVIVSTTVHLTQAEAFHSFIDPPSYSEWLGVPVSIVDRRFSCTMEWGLIVRGRYEVVAPPALIALRWDFERDDLPVPGSEHPAYVRFEPAGTGGTGATVTVHQLVANDAQATFMRSAWQLVLGRLHRRHGT